MESTLTCSTCGLLQQLAALPPGSVAECCRCGSVVGRRQVDSLERTAAFSLAALILYLPANLYPIMRMNFYGAYSESTIWDGCASLFQNGQWLVAAIVFLASIVVPLCKLLGLFFLVVTTKLRSARWQAERTRIHQLIQAVGPWAMLDVFLLAVIVALVKLEQIATVLPGPGLLAFAAVVVLTILASTSFDPRAIWGQEEDER